MNPTRLPCLLYVPWVRPNPKVKERDAMKDAGTKGMGVGGVGLGSGNRP